MRSVAGARGQSTFELALMIVVVVAAVVAMSIFMKRSVMGKLRESGDQIGTQFTPLKSTSSRKTTTVAGRDEDVAFSGFTSTTGVDETRTQTGEESVTEGLDAEALF